MTLQSRKARTYPVAAIHNLRNFKIPILDGKNIILCVLGMIFSFVCIHLYYSIRWIRVLDSCYVHLPMSRVIPFSTATIRKSNINHTETENVTFRGTLSYKQTRSSQPMDYIFDSIHPDWHPLDRKDRFPSVEERVKLYMSNWYYPRCMNTPPVNFTIQYINDSYPFLTVYGLEKEKEDQNVFDSIILSNAIFILHEPTLFFCANKFSPESNSYYTRIQSCEPIYSQDGLDILKISEVLDSSLIDKSTVNRSLLSTPFLALFGDGWPKSRSIPVISKYRGATSTENLQKVLNPYIKCISSSLDERFLKIVNRRNGALNAVYGLNGLPYYQPIVWKFNDLYNFDVDLKNTPLSDIPWEAKKKMCAFWAGNMTGPMLRPTSIPTPTDLEICLSNAICSFVYNHVNSSIIRASLSDNGDFFTKDYINRTINGISLTGPALPLKDFLECKVVISFEGNVASRSLKWQLLSNSVVLMPRPTLTSWLMEELLVPWVHYVPILEDGSDAEQMIEWVAHNDEQAHRIAERGTLFMHDYLYHPQAEVDDTLIKTEIVKRYHQFWH